jgi:hypothetical protein
MKLAVVQGTRLGPNEVTELNRAAREPKASTGWSIELGPFPGSKNLLTW